MERIILDHSQEPDCQVAAERLKYQGHILLSSEVYEVQLNKREQSTLLAFLSAPYKAPPTILDQQQDGVFKVEARWSGERCDGERLVLSMGTHHSVGLELVTREINLLVAFIQNVEEQVFERKARSTTGAPEEQSNEAAAKMTNERLDELELRLAVIDRSTFSATANQETKQLKAELGEARAKLAQALTRAVALERREQTQIDEYEMLLNQYNLLAGACQVYLVPTSKEEENFDQEYDDSRPSAQELADGVKQAYDTIRSLRDEVSRG